MDVISDLIGVPESDRRELRRLADCVVHREDGVLDVPLVGMEAALTLAGYYADLITQRRRRAAADLTSALIDAEIDGDKLTDDEVIGFLLLMMVAGNETTTKLLANAIYWGSANPGELAKPLNDPLRVPDWVEETLRYDASSQAIAWTVTEDFEAHGRVIPTGGRLLLLVGSANRDRLEAKRLVVSPTAERRCSPRRSSRRRSRIRPCSTRSLASGQCWPVASRADTGY